MFFDYVGRCDDFVEAESVIDRKKPAVTNTSDKKEDKIKTEIRSILMIVLNSFSNFVLRLPELISIIFFYSLSYGEG